MPTFVLKVCFVNILRNFRFHDIQLQQKVNALINILYLDIWVLQSVSCTWQIRNPRLQEVRSERVGCEVFFPWDRRILKRKLTEVEEFGWICTWLTFYYSCSFSRFNWRGFCSENTLTSLARLRKLLLRCALDMISTSSSYSSMFSSSSR